MYTASGVPFLSGITCMFKNNTTKTSTLIIMLDDIHVYILRIVHNIRMKVIVQYDLLYYVIVECARLVYRKGCKRPFL